MRTWLTSIPEGLFAARGAAAVMLATGAIGLAPTTVDARAGRSPDGDQASRAESNEARKPPVVLARRPAEDNTKDRSRTASAPRPADGRRPAEPLVAVISIASQHIDVYSGSGRIQRSRVSTGRDGHATPTGVFSIMQRNRYHRSNIYSNAPMPYMQRLTWSGIALHEGHVPNYRASHGCIRLPGAFARTMWGLGRLGMRVIVSPSDVAPGPFEHAKLPSPRLIPETKTTQSDVVRVATAGDSPPATDGVRHRTPYQIALDRLVRAKAAKIAADKAVKPAFDLATAKSAAARQASEALKASAGILADAKEQLDYENLGMGTVQTEEAEARILERIKLAEASVKAAQEAHDKLVAAEQVTSDEAFAAARAAREAREAAETADVELREARRGDEPISVFVSRNTGKVYVRQSSSPLFEENITIAEPDRPLGTHVFTAMHQTEDGRGISWSSVSVPTSGGERRRKGEERATASSATEALDRLTFPPELMQLVSERLWPGASIIISDYGLGETNKGTDFVILTR